MLTLKDKFPNFVEAMLSIKADTDLRLIKNNESNLKYRMSLVAFKNKLGDIDIELNKIELNRNESFVIVFYTLSNNQVKAKTLSKFIKSDLSKEDWIIVINETMINHNQNAEHMKVAMNFLHNRLSSSSYQKSGCVLTFIGLTILSFIVLTIF